MIRCPGCGGEGAGTAGSGAMLMSTSEAQVSCDAGPLVAAGGVLRPDFVCDEEPEAAGGVIAFSGTGTADDIGAGCSGFGSSITRSCFGAARTLLVDGGASTQEASTMPPVSARAAAMQPCGSFAGSISVAVLSGRLPVVISPVAAGRGGVLCRASVDADFPADCVVPSGALNATFETKLQKPIRCQNTAPAKKPAPVHSTGCKRPAPAKRMRDGAGGGSGAGASCSGGVPSLRRSAKSWSNE